MSILTFPTAYGRITPNHALSVKKVIIIHGSNVNSADEASLQQMKVATKPVHPDRRLGGPVPAGKTYLVGEEGTSTVPHQGEYK